MKGPGKGKRRVFTSSLSRETASWECYQNQQCWGAKEASSDTGRNIWLPSIAAKMLSWFSGSFCLRPLYSHFMRPTSGNGRVTDKMSFLKVQKLWGETKLWLITVDTSSTERTCVSVWRWWALVRAWVVGCSPPLEHFDLLVSYQCQQMVLLFPRCDIWHLWS